MKYIKIIITVILAWLKVKKPTELDKLLKGTRKEYNDNKEKIEAAEADIEKSVSDGDSDRLDIARRLLHGYKSEEKNIFARLGKAFYRSKGYVCDDD